MRASLKIKLFIFLLVVTASVITFFTVFTITDFKIDKTAQTLESNLFAIKSVALQIRSEIDSAIEKSGFYLKGLNPETGDLPQNSDSLAKLDPNLIGLWVIGLDPGSSEPILKTSIPAETPLPTLNSQLMVKSEFLQEALASGFCIYLNQDDSRSWFLAFRINGVNPLKPLTVVLHLRNAKFSDLFTVNDLFDILILNRDSLKVTYATQEVYRNDIGLVNSLKSFLKNNSKQSQGIIELKTISQDMLVTYSTLGIANYIVVGLKDKSSVFASIQRHIQKTWFFSGFIFFILLGISVVVSVSLTRRLSELVKGTEKISQGHFDIKIDTHSSDEFGVLADSFNHMANEVQRLLVQTKESARMELELKTAQAIQQNLFPKSEFSNHALEIAGHYTPASECGGDWWYYHLHGDDVYLWIGDATGHGVHATLVTSAVRAVAAMTEEEPASLENIATRLNLSVHATSRGFTNMTFFLARLNMKTLKLHYVNCSHEPPILIPQKKSLKKQDLIPLNDSNCPRLGESKDTEFKVSEIDLPPDSILFIYTDGLFDVTGPNNNKWSERSFHKFILSNNNHIQSAVSLRDYLVEHLNSFRRFEPLIDDLTFFAVNIKNQNQ